MKDPTCALLDRLPAQADEIQQRVENIATLVRSPKSIDEQIAECRRIAILEARRRGLSIDDADDVAQDVCLKLLLFLREGKVVQHIPAWTRKATSRHVIDLHRVLSHPARGYGLMQSLSDYDDTQDGIGKF